MKKPLRLLPFDQDEGDAQLDWLHALITNAAAGAVPGAQSDLGTIRNQLLLYVDPHVPDAAANQAIRDRVGHLVVLIRAHQRPVKELEAKHYQELLDRIKDQQPGIYKAHDDDEDLSTLDPGWLGLGEIDQLARPGPLRQTRGTRAS